MFHTAAYTSSLFNIGVLQCLRHIERTLKNAPKLNSSLLGPVLDFGSRMKTGCFNFYLLI